MDRELQLQIAFRRNQQLRSSETVANDIALSLGIRKESIHVVNADSSVILERKMEAMHERCLTRGEIHRRSELQWPDVTDILASYAGPLRNECIIVYLCHFRDFAISMSFADFIHYAQRLVMFDGDSAFATTIDGCAGIGIDMYQNDSDQDMRVTLDIWPNDVLESNTK